MILFLLYLLIVVLLGLIFWEDFKFRLVNVLYFVGLAFIGTCVFFVQNKIFSNVLYSLLFLILNLFFIKLYTVFRFKDGKESLFKIPDLAEGDIIFFLVIIPLFSFLNYVIFFISGLIFSLLIHFFVKAFIDDRNTIPLAGYLALYLIIVILSSLLVEASLYVNLTFCTWKIF